MFSETNWKIRILVSGFTLYTVTCMAPLIVHENIRIIYRSQNIFFKTHCNVRLNTLSSRLNTLSSRLNTLLSRVNTLFSRLKTLFSRRKLFLSQAWLDNKQILAYHILTFWISRHYLVTKIPPQYLNIQPQWSKRYLQALAE